MQKTISLKLLPSEAANDTTIKQHIAKAEGIKVPAISGFTILKQSIDARGRQPWINLSLKAYINEPFQQREMLSFDFKDVKNAERRILKVIIALAKVVPVHTAMGNFIPGAASGETLTASLTCLYILGQKKISYTNPIRISVLTNYRILLQPCGKK